MTRQITSNIGLTYEEDKSKTFSYDNDIKNNMVTIDSEIGSAKNRLSDIENNTEYPQFTPLLTQDSAVFSTGSGRSELGVEVDLRNDIVRGQVSVGVKGNTYNQIIKNGNFANGITNWLSNMASATVSNKIVTLLANGLHGSTYQKFQPKQDEIWFFYSKVKSTTDNARFIVTDNINFTYVIKDHSGSNTYEELYKKQAFNTIIASDTWLQIRDSRSSGWDEIYVDGNAGIFAINMTANGIEDYTEAQMLEIARMGYWEGVKSTLPVRLKSVNKNLFDKSTALIGRSLNNGNSVELDSSEYSHSDFIRIDNSKGYKLSGRIQTTINYHDSNKKFLRQTTGTNNVTPSNGEVYIRFNIHPGDLDTAQIEEGTVATNYTKHEFSEAYINLSEGEELRSLPNGVKDEVKDGKLYKRTNTIILNGTTFTGTYGTFTNTYSVPILKASYIPNAVTNNTISAIATSDDGEYEIANTPLADTRNICIHNDSYAYLHVEKSKIDSQTGATILEKFQAYMNLYPLTLIYQLATEQITNIPTTPLIAYSKGTIIIEPFMYKKFNYNNGITWTMPVDKIEEIKKTSTGKTITDYTLSNDGLSVTINNALNGEEYTIKAPIRNEESTIPTTVMSYPTNINAANKSNAHAINQLSKIVSELLVSK